MKIEPEAVIKLKVQNLLSNLSNLFNRSNFFNLSNLAKTEKPLRTEAFQGIRC